MKKLISEISSDAIIGVLGTLAGTGMGFFLSMIQNNIGYIKISFKDFMLTEYGKEDVDENFNAFYTDKNDGIYNLVIKFKVYIFNCKNKISGIYDERILVKYGRKKTLSEIADPIPYKVSEVFAHYKNIDLINLNPNEAAVLNCEQSIKLDEGIKYKYKIYFQYKINGKLFIRKKLLYKSSLKSINRYKWCLFNQLKKMLKGHKN